MKDEISELSKPKNQKIFLILILAIIGFVFFLIPYLVTHASWGWSYGDETGVIGDTLGGIIAPIVGFIGVILTFLAFYIQFEANKMQMRAIRTQERQTAFQQFENTFFRLLENHEKYLSKKHNHLSDDTNYDKLSFHWDDFRSRLNDYSSQVRPRTFKVLSQFDYDINNEEIYKEETIRKTLKNINSLVTYIDTASDEIVPNKNFYHSILQNALRESEQNIYAFQWIMNYPYAIQNAENIKTIYCQELYDYLNPTLINFLFPPRISITLNTSGTDHANITSVISNQDDKFPKINVNFYEDDENIELAIVSATLTNRIKEKKRLNEGNIYIKPYEEQRISIYGAFKDFYIQEHKIKPDATIEEQIAILKGVFEFEMNNELELQLNYKNKTYRYRVILFFKISPSNSELTILNGYK